MSDSAKKTAFNEEMRVITLRDLLETLFRNVRFLMITVAVFFAFAVIYVYCKTPVFQSRALLKISKSDGGSSGLLSQVTSGSGMGSFFSQNKELGTEQYILGSAGVLAKAVSNYHLDVVVTPWHFPILGSALANHYDHNLANLGLPAKPKMGLSRYSWGGDSVHVDQFVVPSSWEGKAFTLIYLGNNQYQLLSKSQIILTGTIGQLSTVTNGSDTVSLLISQVVANLNTHFTIEKLPMLSAIARLKSKIQINPAGMQTDLLSLVVKGQPREDLQVILNSVINNVIDLSIRTRAEKAEKVLAFINAQLPKIHNQLNVMNIKLSNMLPIGSEFANLEREKSIQSLVYSNMLIDVEQYDLQKASSLGDITVITSPTPLSPAQLPGFMQAMLITFIGLLLGVCYVFARHFLMGIVFDPEQVEQITGLSLLTGLQTVKSQTQQAVLYKKKRIDYIKLLSELEPNGAALEGFRSLRTSLFLNHFMRDDDQKPKNNIIAITGPIPGIGKSFISTNLAQQMAETGKRILLIDADMRKGTIANYFEPSIKKRGFIDLIKGQLEAKDCILKTRFNNLDMLPSGELQSRNAEFLLKENVERLLSELSKQYDYVVIDTPPILLVSDALSICQHAALNLLVLAHGKHNEREIDVAVKRFEKSNITLHGFVMNFIPMPKMGYGYGYGYGYGHAYGHDEKSTSS
ncbi:MAG: polysaccharide biosynthesis tyrosine autokinase [Gammaproteobacteria bacterium]|nr:polysaccharide biosynthesis tyrosine autokinase [Gammaproteobacteria bacterium]